MKNSDLISSMLLMVTMFMLFIGVIINISDCHDLQVKKMDEIIKVMESKK